MQIPPVLLCCRSTSQSSSSSLADQIRFEFIPRGRFRRTLFSWAGDAVIVGKIRNLIRRRNEKELISAGHSRTIPNFRYVHPMAYLSLLLHKFNAPVLRDFFKKFWRMELSKSEFCFVNLDVIYWELVCRGHGGQFSLNDLVVLWSAWRVQGLDRTKTLGHLQSGKLLFMLYFGISRSSWGTADG